MQATFLFVVSLNSDPLFLFSYFVFLYTFVSCVDYLFRAIFFLLIYIFFLLTTCSFFLRLVLLLCAPFRGCIPSVCFVWLIIKIGINIIRIFVINILVITLHWIMRRRSHTISRPPGHSRSPRLLLLAVCPRIMIGRRTADNGFPDPADPIILRLFGIGIQQVGRVRGGNFKTIPFSRFQIGRFHRRTQC